jgi:hypothetical protein
VIGSGFDASLELSHVWIDVSSRRDRTNPMTSKKRSDTVRGIPDTRGCPGEKPARCPNVRSPFLNRSDGGEQDRRPRLRPGLRPPLWTSPRSGHARHGHLGAHVEFPEGRSDLIGEPRDQVSRPRRRDGDRMSGDQAPSARATSEEGGASRVSAVKKRARSLTPATRQWTPSRPTSSSIAPPGSRPSAAPIAKPATCAPPTLSSEPFIALIAS